MSKIFSFLCPPDSKLYEGMEGRLKMLGRDYVATNEEIGRLFPIDLVLISFVLKRECGVYS
jgi:hypothetical protein